MLSCILHYIARLDCRGGSHDERQTIAGFNSQNLALPTDSVQASYLPRAGGGVVCSCPIYGNFGGENVKIWTHTHTHIYYIYIYVYIYISYITYHISYIYLFVLSCHSPILSYSILSYLKAMDLGTLFFFQNLGRDSHSYKLENICQCYMKFASVAPPSCNICSSRHFSGQVLKGGDLTTVPFHQIDPNWIFSEFQKRTNK